MVKDDLIITVAVAFSISAAGPFFMFFKIGYISIQHENGPTYNESRGRLFAYIVDILYPPSASLAKSSILFFLLGQQSSSMPIFRIPCHAVNVIILLAMVTILFTTMFQCLPIRRAWQDLEDGGEKCVDRSLLRVARTFWAINGFSGSPGQAPPLVWITTPIEASLIIIAACVPTLGPLFRRRFPPPSPQPEEPASHSDSNQDLSHGSIVISHIPKDHSSDSSLVLKPLGGFGYTDTEIRPGSRRVVCTRGIMRTMDVDVAFGERRAEDGIRAATWGWS
ncbi:hypothetical protein SAPIO_CDS9901 [Scedosporium apiospermum]|uniref:Rhodopsin domain-containing protein n=1 Tax=Pseudallescheria apiosperma TaxID=563466 RepID=A0A084FVW9_PSEDA|nr:uncharacterized protein SAPIO_CDS9901 [Scedosporium apiospermum]KEZ39231.1 hypothetical protein SAPIO_CDS9901 [Scedosporium apiospermum]